MSYELPARSFLGDLWAYAARMRYFRRDDWGVYALWVGLMTGLLCGVGGFLLSGVLRGVVFPVYVWNVPLGIFIFLCAIALDTIGHRTAYKEVLTTSGEELVHHVTIFAGIASVVLLCVAYQYPTFCTVPALVFTALSIFYSVIDEAMHWIRFASGRSDRIEMWSHFFIFVGHLIMMAAWVQWFLAGYPGVAETLAAASKG